jgi:2-polyprenyl-3-methyl-5-hydroxy-6-metoxy-1,4-benzoquinol methylase
VESDPLDLLNTENSFEAVISTEVIEHLYSPHLLPRFAKSILKDNGFLIISTPYHGFIKNLALSLFDHWDAHHSPLWHGGHIKFWSRKTLTKLLLEGGFKVTSFHGTGRLPFLWKSMILVAEKI